MIAEYKGNWIKTTLAKRGYISYTQRNNPAFWAIDSWENTLVKLNYKADVVFFGNSITAGSNFQHYFPSLDICNLGYSGDFLVAMPSRITMIKAVDPKKIFIMAGINDLMVTKDQNLVIERYDSFLSQIKDSFSDKDIYIQSILPINEKMQNKFMVNEKIMFVNNQLKRLCLKYNFAYIDLYSIYEVNNELPEALTKDGVHLKTDAYDLWANHIEEYIID